MNNTAPPPYFLSPYGRTVLRDLGVVLHVPGIMALVTLVVAVLAREWFALPAFLITALASVTVGQVLYRIFRSHGEPLRVANAMTAAVLAWTATPLFAALPFMIMAWTAPESGTMAGEWVRTFANPLSAFFEATSGFTSTGLTMVEHPSQLPHTLQWWRSFLQWVGGVGIILATLTVFHPSGDAYRLYFSEGREQIIGDDVTASVLRMWWIYVLYTLAGAALLWLAGVDAWTALNHAMTAIATGGFSITDGPIDGVGVTVKLILVLLMIMGAISFAAHFRLLITHKPGFLWKDAEIHAFVFLLLGGFIAISLENWWYGGAPLVIDSLFQWTSALTTTGFQTTDITLWSPTGLLLLSLAMIIGGMGGATTGGLKIKRLVLLVDAALARVHGVAQHPWRLMDHRPITGADEDVHATRALEAAVIMTGLWLVLLLVAVIVMLHTTPAATPLSHALLEVASALGNVGLSTGVTSSDMSWAGKLTLMSVMWLGRLEIVPVLVFASLTLRWLRANRP
ncbi:MAG TPA: TrkH family potassium uptake protein [Magnetovibrio sp.]